MLKEFFDEAGHFVIYMVRKYIEANCTCGSQDSNIHNHSERCNLRYETARYLAHAQDRAVEAAKPKPTAPPAGPVRAMPFSVTGGGPPAPNAPARSLVPASPLANLPPIPVPEAPLPPSAPAPAPAPVREPSIPVPEAPLPPHNPLDTQSIIAALRGKSPEELAKIAEEVQKK